MLVALLLYQFFTASSSSDPLKQHIILNRIHDLDAAKTLIMNEKLYNLIENITIRHSVNMKLWVIFIESRVDVADFSFIYRRENMMKIFYTTNHHHHFAKINAFDRRDYAAIFLSHTNDNNLENWLSMSQNLPPDLIKIYVNHNNCYLNKSMLSKIMSKLWHSHEKIGFIYYISLCMKYDKNNNTSSSRSSASTTRNVSDYGLRSHRNNYIINLFYYQPFRKHKSVATQLRHEWGKMEKINLINDTGGNEEWIDMSSEAFHYFPFDPHKLNFNGYLLTVILFPSTMAYFRSEMNIFKKNLSIETFHDPFHNVDAYFGEDVEALLEFQRLLNFTINLSPTSDMGFYGFKLKNGSFNGALGDLINKRADFMSNACFVKDYLTDNRLEFTNAINDDKLCIVVQTAAMVPDALLIFSLFGKSVWILILITILIACLTHAILLTLIDEIEYRRKNISNTLWEFRYNGYKSFASHLIKKIRNDTNIAFRIIAILFGVSYLKGFNNSSYIRFFLSICLVWSVVLTGAFQGLLYNVYSTHKSYPNIDTLDDLYKSELEIHVRHPGLLIDIFGDGKDDSIVGNLRRRLKTSSNDFLNKQIVMKGDIVALERYANYDSENNKLEPREDGVSNLHLVAECPRSYTLSYLLPKRSIYIKSINRFINVFMQSGLTAKWQRDSKFYFNLERRLKSNNQYKASRIKINLQHLEVAFFILFFGYIISAAAFVVE